MSQSTPALHKLKISDDVLDLIRSLHPTLKRKVKSALKKILQDPSSGKALKEELRGLSSFRVGRLRIIYRTAPRRVIEIVAIGPRKAIYKETYRLVKRESKQK
jgi:mRNA interferase RelE/StbE